MAQRTFPCNKCGQVVEVPDDCFSAIVNCRNCGAPYHRLTGKPALSANPARPVASPFPGQGAPTQLPAFPATGQFRNTPQYPAYPAPQRPYPGGPQGAPLFPGQYHAGFAQVPPKKTQWWIIPAAIGGVVVVAILVLAAIPLLAGSGDLTNSSEWYEYTSVAGGFSAKFPGKPVEETKNLDTVIGQRTMYRARYFRNGLNYEISYFNADDFDFTAGLALVADTVKGRVVSSSECTIAGLPANRGVVENDKGYRDETAAVQAGGRVYLLLIERTSASKEIHFDVFLAGFKLLGDGPVSSSPLAQWNALYKPGASWEIKTISGGNVLNYMRTEVLSANDDGVLVRNTLLDKDRQPLGGMKPTEYTLQFTDAQAPGNPSNVKGEARIKQWDCVWEETGGTGEKSKIWYMKKYGKYLPVRMESAVVTTELISFTPGK